MSILPYLFESYPVFRPSRMLDQRFGLVLDPDDLLQPLTVQRSLTRCPAGYIRNWRSATSDSDAGSVVTFDKEKFQASLDVAQFKPEEISVNVTDDNVITIEGKHEEKEDEHGHIYRHFIRRYAVPKGCDVNKLESKLSSDCVLTVTAPRIEEEKIQHKDIQITQTGKPSKEIENTK